MEDEREERKGRIWAFIAYPESIKGNWIQELEETGVQFAVSPLHDKDIDPTGEPKKPHWHVQLQFTGPTTYNNVKKICDNIGATAPKKIESARGYYRYLIHADNPEKAQYEYKDIKNYNGFEIDLSETEETVILKQVCQIIRNKKIKEYKNLLDYFEEIGDNDMWKICSKKTIFLNSYLSSYRNQEREQNQRINERERDHMRLIKQVQNKVIK